MTRAMDPEVADAIWAAIEPILPVPVDDHPLGCHNPRVPDRVCFRGILIRLVTGVVVGRHRSDHELRGLRHHAAGPPRRVDRQPACSTSSRPKHVPATTGSSSSTWTWWRSTARLHKAPCGGEGTGHSPVDRAKLGWKWSVASERSGIPIGWSIDGANRNDVVMLEPTLDAIADNGLLAEIGTLTLDRSYDYPKIRNQLHARGLARVGHPTPRHQAPARRPAPAHARAALGRRSDQHVVVELRPTTPQHRPQDPPPPRRPPARHRRAHRRPTHRLPQPMEPRLSTYPLKSLHAGLDHRSPRGRQPLASTEAPTQIAPDPEPSR